MISDVLSEAVDEINRYLDDPDTYGYTGVILTHIEQVRDEMDALRIQLDTPPEQTA